MNKPKEPILRIIREGSVGLCKKCGSSLEYKWDFIFQFGELGCIQPLCENYYLRDNGR